MGLSGRKVKQRISADPRNLSWADDAARFGSNYLSKFGWDSSKGLGAGGDGMKSHIKVSHKLDMLGIGAAQTKDPNGIAWKQNRDFENLLRRLNEKLDDEQTPVEDETEEEAGDDQTECADEEGKKKKKRKHKETTEEDGSERKKKKKKSKENKEGEDEEQSVSVQVDSMQLDAVVETKSVSVEVKKLVALPRHRAHRARAIAAKNIASKSSAHISEILGIAPDPLAYQKGSMPAGKLTSVTETDALGMDKIKTSTKSLADYFKEKLDARSSKPGSATPSSSASADEADAYDAPRMGLGASRMRLEIHSETRIEEETQRMGLSKFSSLMSSSFLSATSLISSYVPPAIEKDEPMGDSDEGIARISEVESDSETKDRSKKSEKKEKKRRKDTTEHEVEKVDEKKEKKGKKDKKGKGKVELEEEKDIDEDEKKRGKKEKKEKRRAEKLKLEAVTVEEKEDNEHRVDGDDTAKATFKEKRKHKSEGSSTTPLESEDSRQSRKKKKHRTSSSADP